MPSAQEDNAFVLSVSMMRTMCVVSIPLMKSPLQNTATNHVILNSMKLVIPLHSLYWSIHTKDESKRRTAFAFIFGVN